MSKNTDSSIKLLVLYDILLKTTDDEIGRKSDRMVSCKKIKSR